MNKKGSTTFPNRRRARFIKTLEGAESTRFQRHRIRHKTTTMPHAGICRIAGLVTSDGTV